MADPSSEQSLLDELAEDFVARRRRGEGPSVEEYVEKYPALAEQIRDLFPALSMMEEIRPDQSARTGEFTGDPAEGATPVLERLGDFRILREIGRGGMGIVYEAEQESLGRHVALKVLPAHTLLDPQRLQRFQREARAAARLHHTNIVPVFGVGEHEGLHYYVMQFIQGQGLDQILAELARFQRPNGPVPAAPPEGALPNTTASAVSAGAIAQALNTGQFANASAGEEEGSEACPSGVHLPGQPDHATLTDTGRHYWQSVARIGVQVAEAMTYAHSQGILHRDIKPSNLLLDLQGTVWVTDFGLAKASGSENLTHTGDLVGTLRYMAPERFSGQSDLRSDLYALGLTLYELLTLRPAFDGTDPNKLIPQIVHEEPPRPRKIRPRVPADLETIVLKATAKEPAHRYQTTADLAADLQRFLEDRPIQARRVGPAERLWRWSKRNPVMASLIGAVALLLLAVTVGAILSAVYYGRMAESEQRAKNEAEKTAEESRQRLAQQYLASGVRLMDDGDPSGSLPWFTESLRLQQGDPERDEVHRLRLAAVLRQCPRLTQFWPHQGLVNAASFSRDGRRVVTASTDKTARVWDVQTGQPVCAPLVHDSALIDAEFSPDGAHVVTATGEVLGGNGPGEAHIWEVETGRLLAGPLRHEKGLSHASFSPDGARILTASWDGTVQLWDAVTGESLLKPALRHSLGVIHAEFSPDGQQILTACWDGTARIWHLSGGEPLSLKHDFPLLYAALSPDGRTVATCSSDGAARLWNATTGDLIGKPLQHGSLVIRAAFSPDGHWVATSSWDGTARVWDATTGEPRTHALKHEGVVQCVAFSPDGHSVVTGSYDNTVRVWDAATGEQRVPPLKHGGFILQAAWGPDGRFLLTASGDQTARLWDLSTGGSQAPALQLHNRVAAISPDGRRVVTTGELMRVCDVATGEPRTPPLKRSGSYYVYGGWFSPDGRTVATVGFRERTLWGGDSEVCLWDADTGKALGQPIRLKNIVYHAAFSADGHSLVCASGPLTGIQGEGEAQVWNARTGQLIAGPFPHASLVFCAQWNAAGDRVVTGCMDERARVWDVKTGQEVLAFRHTSPVAYARFSPDDRRVVTVTLDGAARLWETADSRQPLATLQHRGMVTHASFSPDGACMATTCQDQTARLWDGVTGAPLTPPLQHRTALIGAAFSPDGRRLITLTEEGAAQVWDVATGRSISPPRLLGDVEMRDAFIPKRKYVLAFEGNWEQLVRLWDLDLSPDRRPLEDLVRHAQLLSCQQLSSQGGMASLDPAALAERWETLRQRYPKAFAPEANSAEVLDWHRRQAEECVGKKQWTAAVEHFDRLIQDGPPRWGDHVARARALIPLRRWSEAAADFAAAVELGVTDGQVWFDQAIVLLTSGDLAGHRRACARLLERYGETDDPMLAGQLVWCCKLAPGAVDDPDRLVQLAEKAVAENPRNSFYLSHLGGALYRAGRFEEAVQRLTEADKAHPRKDDWDWFWLAMAHQRLGHADEARKWLDKALQEYKTLQGREEINLVVADAPLNTGVLELEILRREAEATVLGQSKQPPE
jgi:WD40 repeat protein/serine/threonine protein kinase/Flp pilus assembly protein TadD